jgi:hypothetical protein
MVGNLRRNEKNNINVSRDNKPYYPWLISFFDLSSEEDRADDVNKKPLTKELSQTQLKLMEAIRTSVKKNYSNDYSINIGTDLQ